ncbi:DNA polymerase III subunit delta [Dehalogenimonas sp. THU2]|uniref:DNA polymerase III subunit delta n=1 Tax=Dehalogenimonas sp. THU2 TaxID=3151121 RepID=UPI0032186A24
MRYLLAGPDDFSLKAKLNSIKASLGDPAMLSTATNIFDAARLKPAEFRLTVHAAPFLSPARLVVVSGLFSRFQPASGDAGGKKKTKPEDIEEFAGIVRSSPPSTTLILTETSLNRTNPLFKSISDVLEMHEFPPLDKPQLKEWIGRRVLHAGGQISPGAINLLVQYVGADLWSLATEIDKLTLFACERVITENDVKALVGSAQEANIFSLVDAIFEQRLKTATTSLESLKASGFSAGYVLSMLARQLRLVIQIKDLKSRGEKDMEIRRRLGLNADFVWKKALDQAGRFSIDRFKDIYRQLLEADIAAKTGRMDETMSIDLLVAELATRS